MNKLLRVIAWPFDWAGEKVALAFIRLAAWQHAEGSTTYPNQDVSTLDGGYLGPWRPDLDDWPLFNVDGTPMLGPNMDYSGNFYCFPGPPD